MSDKILVIAAHPQDPFERAGGTAAKHLARGDQVMFVSLTTGVVTHAFNVFPPQGADKLKNVEKIKELKRKEFEAAARVLGLTAWKCLDFPESPMIMGLEHYITMVNLIREFRPNVVLCAHPVETGRQDHMDSGRFAVAAVDYARAEGFPSPLAPHTVAELFMFYYQDFRADQLMGTSRQSPGVVLDITPVIAKKRAAQGAFEGTQSKKPGEWMEAMTRFQERVEGAAAWTHGFEYAELFVRWNPERVKYLPLNS